MSDSYKVIVRNIDLRASEQMLKIVFDLGEKKFQLRDSDDANTQVAEIDFPSAESAIQFNTTFNNKKIIDKAIKVELNFDNNVKQTNGDNMGLLQKFKPKQKDSAQEFIGAKKEQQQNTYKQTRREIFGEIIYPLACEKYTEQAAKLTGMIVNSLDQNYDRNETNLNQILNSKNILYDLIEAAHSKLIATN